MELLITHRHLISVMRTPPQAQIHASEETGDLVMPVHPACYRLLCGVAEALTRRGDVNVILAADCWTIIRLYLYFSHTCHNNELLCAASVFAVCYERKLKMEFSRSFTLQNIILIIFMHQLNTLYMCNLSIH